MKISESRGFRSITLFVSGILDSTTGDQLQNEIFRAVKININVTLDFADVESADKGGAASLHIGRRAVAGKRGIFQILNAQSKVKKVLLKEGLGSVLVQ